MELTPEQARLIGSIEASALRIKVPPRPRLGLALAPAVAGTICTLVAGMVAFGGKDHGFTPGMIATILVVHFGTMYPPLAYMFREYRRHKDVMDPCVVSAASFAVFHIAFNPLVLTSYGSLAARKLQYAMSEELTETALMGYAIVFVSWVAYRVGCSQMLAGSGGERDRGESRSQRTLMFLWVGIAFVIIGIIGNIGSLGSWQLYLQKMTQFFARWTIYEEAMDLGGSMKWPIASRFLPVGLTVLAYGYARYCDVRDRSLLLYLGSVAIVNVFLNCATGQRSDTLMVVLYSVVVVNHSIRRLSVRQVAAIVGVFLCVSMILGSLRDAEYFDTSAADMWRMNAQGFVEHFTDFYMTNFLGTLTLVAEVRSSGTVGGMTAFAGLTGLLGGETPVTTQAEVFYRLIGRRQAGNPRYGPPGEFYFNFGWVGVILGMAGIGMVIALCARIYRGCKERASVYSAMVAIFAVLTAQFLVIANLSYIPPYFTYTSAAPYLVFFCFRNRRC